MAILDDIKTKVRRIAKAPSFTQLSNDELETYINTFILYDFPQIVQVFDLQKNISFCTTPYVDKYSTTSGAYILNLKDFKNNVISIDRPIYIAGRQIKLSQNPEEFYNMYSQTKQLGTIGTGDGVTTAYTYTLPTTVLHNSVIIGTLNTVGEAIIVKDVPDTDTYGREANTGELHDQADVNIGTINYLTGAIVFDYIVGAGGTPQSGVPITFEMYPFKATIPDGILFFDNTFTLRPVPDKVYEVELQVRVQPTKLLATGTTTPEIEQWWQYIAYGAILKIFQDRSDIESVQNVMPEFKRQENLVMRKTMYNKSKERSATIFVGTQNITDQWFYNG